MGSFRKAKEQTRLAFIVILTRLAVLLHNICTVFLLAPIELVIALLRPLCPPSVFRDWERDIGGFRRDWYDQYGKDDEAEEVYKRCHCGQRETTDNARRMNDSDHAPNGGISEDSLENDRSTVDGTPQTGQVPPKFESRSSCRYRVRRYLRESVSHTLASNTRLDQILNHKEHRSEGSSALILRTKQPLTDQTQLSSQETSLAPISELPLAISKSRAKRQPNPRRVAAIRQRKQLLTAKRPLASDTVILTDEKFDTLRQECSTRSAKRRLVSDSSIGRSHSVQSSDSVEGEVTVSDISHSPSRFLRMFQNESRPQGTESRMDQIGDHPIRLLRDSGANLSSASLSSRLSTMFRQGSHQQTSMNDQAPEDAVKEYSHTTTIDIPEISQTIDTSETTTSLAQADDDSSIPPVSSRLQLRKVFRMPKKDY
ncbi:uncharacterized protein V2V93DRAFT_372986 [Kockiozyma suomiensis]|uniref:uncharacterized protein n=1 Tax=Kockiozyma suomiensis TaxID=1337062 RepID=UPI003343DED7